MYVKKGESFLENVSLKKLEELYNAETHAKAKLRLQCAILRKKGKSQPFIAEVTSKPISTVSDILRRFEQRGIKGCYARKQTGQPPKLSSQQKIVLKKTLSKSPETIGLPFTIWTTKLIQYYIEKRFGVSYVLRHIRDLMKLLGLSIQSPRPEHLKANKKLQTKFKKNFDDKLRNLCKQDMRSSFWTKAYSH
jgi:transposase